LLSDKVRSDQLVVIWDVGVLMYEALGIHAHGDTCVPHLVDQANLEDSGANSAKHVVAGFPFQNDRVDVLTM